MKLILFVYKIYRRILYQLYHAQLGKKTLLGIGVIIASSYIPVFHGVDLFKLGIGLSLFGMRFKK